MYENQDLPKRDYIMAWLEADRKLAIMGYSPYVAMHKETNTGTIDKFFPLEPDEFIRKIPEF